MSGSPRTLTARADAAGGTAVKFYELRDNLIDGVHPTNNAAERGLRAALIYRKVSHGSQSDAGERFAERMLSVSQTCRLQRRSLFAYLIDAITAAARAGPAPSLA